MKKRDYRDACVKRDEIAVKLAEARAEERAFLAKQTPPMSHGEPSDGRTSASGGAGESGESGESGAGESGDSPAASDGGAEAAAMSSE
jgi:hypothetical protein